MKLVPAKRQRSSPILVFRSRTPAEPRPFSAEKRLVATSIDWMVSMLTRASSRPVTGSEILKPSSV